MICHFLAESNSSYQLICKTKQNKHVLRSLLTFPASFSIAEFRKMAVFPKKNPKKLLQLALEETSEYELLQEYFKRHLTVFKVEIFRELRKRGIRIRQETMLISFLLLEKRMDWPVKRLVVIFNEDLGKISHNFGNWLSQLGHQSVRPECLVICGKWTGDITGYELKKVRSFSSHEFCAFYYRC